jgi:hypothetical protein
LNPLCEWLDEHVRTEFRISLWHTAGKVVMELAELHVILNQNEEKHFMTRYIENNWSYRGSKLSIISQLAAVA